LEDQRVIKRRREEIKKYLEPSENENMTYQNLWDTANAVLTGKFKAVHILLKNPSELGAGGSCL
jgi:hypothetical protein